MRCYTCKSPFLINWQNIISEAQQFVAISKETTYLSVFQDKSLKDICEFPYVCSSDLFNPTAPVYTDIFTNSVDPDMPASSEDVWPESALFVLLYFLYYHYYLFCKLSFLPVSVKKSENLVKKKKSWKAPNDALSRHIMNAQSKKWGSRSDHVRDSRYW